MSSSTSACNIFCSFASQSLNESLVACNWKMQRVWEESKVVDVRVTDGGGGWRRGKAYRFALQRLCSDALCGRNRPALGRKGVLRERERERERERKAQWSHEHWNGPLCWREPYKKLKEVITCLDKEKHNCVFIQSPKNICEQHSDIKNKKKSIKWAEIEMQGSHFFSCLWLSHYKPKIKVYVYVIKCIFKKKKSFTCIYLYVYIYTCMCVYYIDVYIYIYIYIYTLYIRAGER